MARKTNRATAYSYIRFSTPEQAEGDSLRRQTEAATAYAERHGLILDTDLTFRDLGLSAASGANATIGALGQFIEAVDAGKVAPGSYLLVEKLDRLSRDKVRAARDRFEALLDKGINIATLNPERVYSAASYDLTDMIITLVDMSQSRQFSENLSHRVGAAWANKRRRAAEEGHKLTARCPAWLRLRNDEFEIIPERAAIVRRIFAMTLEGHGKATIAHRLNAEGIEPFGDGPSQARKADGWYPSYIQKILRNAAVIGQYQPMKRAEKFERARVPDGPPIENYFPAVLDDPGVFYRVKRNPTGASGKGRNSTLQNVLSGLATCIHCGGRMHYVNKGSSPKGGQYLACDNARRKGTCNAKSVRYPVVLAAVLDNLGSDDIDLAGLLGRTNDNDRERQLADRIDAMSGQISEAESAVENLLDVLSRRPSAAIEKRLAEQETALEQLRQDRTALDDERNALSPGQDSVADATEAIREIQRVMASGDDAAIGAVNVRTNAALKRIIDRIEVGISDYARELFNAVLHERVAGQAASDYGVIEDEATVSINVEFREPERHLVIAADPRVSGRCIAGGVKAGAMATVRYPAA